MKFQTPLQTGTILKRYKRFLADIKLDGQDDVIVAHTANTGSMKTCWEPGWKVLCSFHDNPKRKLKYSLEMTNNGSTWICVNTSLPNKLGIEAIKNGTIKELQGYENLKPEAVIGDSRIDILLSNGEFSDQDLCYVEIKNATLLGENRRAIFPDSVTERGQKHLNELMQLKEQGIRAVMLFIINREDVDSFAPAREIDLKYTHLLEEAVTMGVEVLAYQCSLNENEIKVTRSLPIHF